MIEMIFLLLIIGFQYLSYVLYEAYHGGGFSEWRTWVHTSWQHDGPWIVWILLLVWVWHR